MARRLPERPNSLEVEVVGTALDAGLVEKACVLAAATGVAGILLALGLALAASGLAVAMRQPPSPT